MKDCRYVQYLDTPVGTLRILQKGDAIAEVLRVRMPDGTEPENHKVSMGLGETEQSTGLLEQAKQELNEYFAGQRKLFTLPLNPEGTAFQKRAWEALCTIPYGATISYGEEAKRMGCRCARAVGGANGKNPICIIIPCHRVIRGDGSIGGYTGGLDMKEYLLALEMTPGDGDAVSKM